MYPAPSISPDCRERWHTTQVVCVNSDFSSEQLQFLNITSQISPSPVLDEAQLMLRSTLTWPPPTLVMHDSKAITIYLVPRWERLVQSGISAKRAGQQ